MCTEHQREEANLSCGNKKKGMPGLVTKVLLERPFVKPAMLPWEWLEACYVHRYWTPTSVLWASGTFLGSQSCSLDCIYVYTTLSGREQGDIRKAHAWSMLINHAERCSEWEECLRRGAWRNFQEWILEVSESTLPRRMFLIDDYERKCINSVKMSRLVFSCQLH